MQCMAVGEVEDADTAFHCFVLKQWREDKQVLNRMSLLVALIVNSEDPIFKSAPAFPRLSGSAQKSGPWSLLKVLRSAPMAGSPLVG